MQLIDTNVILRFILNDNVEMAERSAEIIESGAYTKPEVIAEVVYVLKSVYSTPKSKIKSIICGLSDIIRIENSDCIIFAVNLFADTALDFVDCLLVAYHSLNGESVFTFDKKLNRYLNANTDSRLFCIPIPADGGSAVNHVCPPKAPPAKVGKSNMAMDSRSTVKESLHLADRYSVQLTIDRIESCPRSRSGRLMNRRPPFCL